MQSLTSNTETEVFRPELLVKDLVERFTIANQPRRKQESSKLRRERKRQQMLAATNHDPLAQHPRLMKLRAELNSLA